MLKTVDCRIWSPSSVNVIVLLTFASYLRDVDGYKCGTVDVIESKILGGLQTERGAWPFLAALYYDSKFFCAGTLISAKHILTAAHCVQRKHSRKFLQPDDIVILLGKYNLMKIERSAAQRDVEQIFVHPDWYTSNESYDADIAVFVLSDFVDFSNFIRPVCMPQVDELIDDIEATIVGWGLAEHTNRSSHEFIPRETTTWILNSSYCSTIYPIAKFVSTHVFCGGGEGGSPNSGDSGGGLFIRSGVAWIQHGIISSSLSDVSGRKLSNFFSIYTSVSAHLNWITETVKTSGGTVSARGDQLIEDINMLCAYELVFDILYKCSVHTSNVTKDNLRVSNFHGEHLTGYAAENVTEIWFWAGKLNYFPDGIGELFKNIEKIMVGYSDRNLGLKLLQRRNFRHLPNLWYIDVPYNDIEWIDEDSLRDLTNLKSFIMNNNKLRKLYKLTFTRNPHLRHVNVKSNKLEMLPKELFKNNPLLEYVSFENNKLMLISTDFTNFNHLKNIDFRGNVCIDLEFKDNEISSIDFQVLITSFCENITSVERFAIDQVAGGTNLDECKINYYK